MGLWYFFRGMEGKIPLNATQIICLWHVSSHSWVISQCTHTHTHTHTASMLPAHSGGPLTIPSPPSACSHCHTEKVIHDALIPAVLYTPQLPGCRDCLYNEAGPSMSHIPEVLTCNCLVASLDIQNSSARVIRPICPQKPPFNQETALKRSL